jgi:hypothetical protein
MMEQGHDGQRDEMEPDQGDRWNFIPFHHLSHHKEDKIIKKVMKITINVLSFPDQ